MSVDKRLRAAARRIREDGSRHDSSIWVNDAMTLGPCYCTAGAIVGDDADYGQWATGQGLVHQFFSDEAKEALLYVANNIETQGSFGEAYREQYDLEDPYIIFLTRGDGDFWYSVLEYITDWDQETDGVEVHRTFRRLAYKYKKESAAV